MAQPKSELFVTPVVTPGDVAGICRDVRQRDLEEWVAGCKAPLLPSLLKASEMGNAKVALILGNDIKRLAMWGCHSTVRPGVGQAWFIATNECERRVHSMHHIMKGAMADMQALFPVLEAWSLDSNTVHHEWMMRFGWVFEGAFQFVGGLGLTFYKFTLTRKEGAALCAPQP